MNNGNPKGASIRLLYWEKMNDLHLNIFSAKEAFGDLWQIFCYISNKFLLPIQLQRLGPQTIRIHCQRQSQRGMLFHHFHLCFIKQLYNIQSRPTMDRGIWRASIIKRSRHSHIYVCMWVVCNHPRKTWHTLWLTYCIHNQTRPPLWLSRSALHDDYILYTDLCGVHQHTSLLLTQWECQ